MIVPIIRGLSRSCPCVPAASCSLLTWESTKQAELGLEFRDESSSAQFIDLRRLVCINGLKVEFSHHLGN